MDNELRLPASRRGLLRLGVGASAAVLGAGLASNAAAETSAADALRADLEAQLKDRLDEYLASTGTQISPSVVIERCGTRLEYNTAQRHITASIVKVEIMLMLFEHYGTVAAIPADHRALLDRMIRESHNASTTTLYNFLGGVNALVAAHARYGLQNTTPDAQGRWGVGWSSAPDQMIITRLALYEGLLDDEQLALSRQLMGTIVPSQAWGVSAAAADDETVWLKNGWDVESQLGGLWVVNSMGVIGGDGPDPVDLVVLSSGAVNDTEGIPVVEEVARIAREVVDQA
ncbi:serine hydrolase [Glycomyces terrestris]|uniref:Beta-lactamase n=1 Tax=Glycomyces terrestris TaxID=2493553 RepID=A0A426USX8_9ACTN|nr:hypothetical protein [Glycomyces terrestris]RRR96830.1 hypothetical protein EIW28_20505 [Glycomyces terrestris]